MEDFKEAIMEFMKNQNANLEKQRRLGQERYEKQNVRLISKEGERKEKRRKKGRKRKTNF